VRGTTFYRIALVLAVACVVLVASILATRPQPRTTQEGSPATLALSLAVVTDQVIYQAGQPVNITVQVLNTGSVRAELEFGSSCQATYGVEDDGGSTVYNWSMHHSCLTVVTNLSLAPGANKTYEFTWDQVSDDGARVPSGHLYRVVARLLNLHPLPALPRAVESLVQIQPEILNLGFAAKTDRPYYSSGDVADVSITLTNLGFTTVTLHFPNPCFMEFLVYPSGGAPVFNSTRYWACIEMLAQVTLPPGGSTTHMYPWNLSADDGTPLPPAQWYTILPRFIWGDLGYQQYVTRTDIATFYLSP
jgi:hypothetical protein